jgi:NitT/TauT family transport system substrate-binding protein
MTSNRFFTADKNWLPALLAFFVLVLAGCDKATTESNTTQNAAGKNAEAAQEIPLNIGTLKIAALSNLYAADKLGYFKEEGLKVNFTQMGGGAELLPAVSAGKIDITLSIPSTAIQARDKGFDFKMIMQNETSAREGQDTQAVFVNADSGIAGMKDLKGKKVAVNNIGNQMWLSFAEVLKKNGVDKKDVSFIELPFPNMEDALVNKQVDAIFNVEPFTSKMLSNPKLKAISYAATAALPGQPVGAFWASEKWLASNEKAAEKFVNAMKKTTDHLNKNPEETQKIIAEYTGLKLEVIQKMRPINWDTKVDQNTMQGLLKLMKDHGLTNSDLKVESVVFPTALK